MPDHSTQSQYAAAARIPLIKSPAVRVPPPVELPPDIHPLPDSVTPYFVYPFVLEPHVLSFESSRRNTLATYATRREGLLWSRDDEKERRRREALRRVAPGFDGGGTPLEPVRHTGGGGGGGVASSSSGREGKHSSSEPPTTASLGGRGGSEGRGDVMDSLVDELERMVAGATAR